jgi:hypothetical protein
LTVWAHPHPIENPSKITRAAIVVCFLPTISLIFVHIAIEPAICEVSQAKGKTLMDHMMIVPVYVAKYPVIIQLLFSNPSRLSVILVRDELTIVTSRFERKNPIKSLSNHR